uniref:CULLIN_2 domain-containing protein n=1 Tax=Rhabditophanes sp. KR3021 TaxID=114890 RepID=A0AC35UFL0_9BILA
MLCAQYGEFDKEWKEAMLVVLDLLDAKNVTPIRWHDLFTIVNRILAWDPKGTNRMIGALDHELSIYVASAEKLITGHASDIDILWSYVKEWDKYYILSQYFPLPFRQIGKEKSHKKAVYFQYNKLDQENQESPVQKKMYSLWHQLIFSRVKKQILTTTMQLIGAEREGGRSDGKVIESVRQSFVCLDDNGDNLLSLYKNQFLAEYLDSTKKYYQMVVGNTITTNGVEKYMTFMHETLEKEKERASRYLHNDGESLTKLVETVVSVVVVQYQEQLLGQTRKLIQNGDIDKLKILFMAMNLTETGIHSMLNCLQEFVASEGLLAMRESAKDVTTDPEKFVEKLLGLYTASTDLITKAFNADSRFLTIRDIAFREVVNSTEIFKIEIGTTRGKPRTGYESRCPELLANYCDLLLRKSGVSKKLTSEDIDRKLTNLMLVLKYVNSKDMFIKYHKAHLSRRLIMEAYSDLDKEENIINQFRDCGMPTETVAKLYRMLQDQELNKEFNCNLHTENKGKNNNKDFEFPDAMNVKILNEGAWGRGSDFVDVSMSEKLEEAMTHVEEVYKIKHMGRKLSWIHQWSHGTMTFVSNHGKYDLDLSAFQITVINAFQQKPREQLSLDSLKIATKLPINELARTLVSLTAYPKVKSQIILTDVLVINPKNFNDSSKFWLNFDFNIVKNNVIQAHGKLNLIGRLQLNAEMSAQVEQKEIIQLRELRCQEAIVKVLKMRQTCTLSQLQTETIELLKQVFVPNLKIIKEQVEHLISEKLIERKADDLNMFVYIS